MLVKLACTNQESYLDRLPERLVVDGYRYWMAGYETGGIRPWELAWTLYVNELGPRDGGAALSALAQWIQALRTSSLEPRQFFPFQCRRLCRDECLAVSLIAAIQNGEVPCVDFCLDQIAQTGTRKEVRDAADGLAASLCDFGQVLMPVPLTVVEDIAARPKRGQFH